VCLYHQQQEATDALLQYEADMEGELEEAIGALRAMWEDASEGRGKPLSKERLCEIQEELLDLQEQQAAQRIEKEKVRKAKLRQDKLEEMQAKTYSEKMYDLSFAKPEVWRELKAQEMASREQQEVSDAARRERELQDALGAAIDRSAVL